MNGMLWNSEVDGDGRLGTIDATETETETERETFINRLKKIKNKLY